MKCALEVLGTIERYRTIGSYLCRSTKQLSLRSFDDVWYRTIEQNDDDKDISPNVRYFIVDST